MSQLLKSLMYLLRESKDKDVARESKDKNVASPRVEFSGRRGLREIYSVRRGGI